MSKKYWLGYFSECKEMIESEMLDAIACNGPENVDFSLYPPQYDGSIVLYDYHQPDLSPDLVQLYNYERNRIFTYSKNSIRPDLRKLTNYEKRFIEKVISAYEEKCLTMKRKKIEEENFNKKYNSNEFDQDNDENYLSDNYQKNDMASEYWTDVDSNHSSNEEGWFYDD